MVSLKKCWAFPGLEEKAGIVWSVCLYWLVCQLKFVLCHQCIKITKLFIYSHNYFQILPHFLYWCYNNNLLFYSRFIPSPKQPVTLYFTGYSRRKHQGEDVELLCFLKYVNYFCILDFIPDTTQASSTMLFRENKADNCLLLNYKVWMQCLFLLSFCIPGVKENSSIHCWSVLDVCLLWSHERMIFQKCVPIYSNFVEFLMLKDSVLALGIKQIIHF